MPNTRRRLMLSTPSNRHLFIRYHHIIIHHGDEFITLLFHRLVLTEEAGQRDVQATEIENLRSKLILVEERSQHFLSTLVSVRAAVDDEAERAANWAGQFKHDLTNVQIALQVKTE